jgi:hypothetical protein
MGSLDYTELGGYRLPEGESAGGEDEVTDLLTLLDRDPDPQGLGAGTIECEANPGYHRISIGAKLHRLLGQDPPIVLDDQRKRSTVEPVMRDNNVQNKGGPSQDRAGGRNASQLDVGTEALLSQTHREHGYGGGLKRNERLSEGEPGVVRPVRDHDEA